MKRLFQILFLFCALQIKSEGLSAQNNEQVLTQIFNELQQTYQNTPSLSFDVKYTYSNETKPDIILDSLSGTFELNDGNYRYVLDSTETIHNKNYTIILFREDKILYLTKSNDGLKTNPIQSINDFLKKDTSLSFNAATNGQFKTLTINYPPGKEYKQVNLTVDTAAGYLVKAAYIIQTKLLMEMQSEAEQGALSQYDTYARVEVNFFNYSVKAVDTSLFDENKFILHDGKFFKTTEAYKEYKIFLGSLNL